MHYDLLSCPECKLPVDIRVLGISSRLGPTEVNCRCGCVMATERKEWVSFDGLERFRYVVLSLAYVVVAALFGGLSVGLTWYSLTQRPDADLLGFWAPGVAEGMAVTGILVAGLQWWRVKASTRRSPRGEVVPLRGAMGNLVLGLQWKFLVLAFVPPLCAWLASHLWKR